MLSSDKNIETLALLVESVKKYLNIQGEYVKLNIIDKMVRLVTALTLTIVFVILGVAVLFYLSFALVYWLEPLTGTALAFFLMAVLFGVLLVLVFVFRKSWIERPLVRFLANLLFS